MKIKSVIIGLALIAASLLVDARTVVRRPPQGGNMPPVSGEIGNYQPGRGYPQGQVISRQIYIGRFMRDETIQLDQVLPRPGGYETALIRTIEIDLQDSGRGALTLMVDGFREDFVNFLQPHTVIRPYRQLEFGRNFRSLGLQVNGKVYIDRVTVTYLSNGGYPDPGGPGHGEIRVSRELNRYLYNFNNTDLTYLLGLDQYRGYRIVSIDVETRNLDSRTIRLSLLANGQMQDDRQVSSYMNELTSLRLRNSGVIGRDVNNLSLLTDGSVHLQRVTLRLVR